MASKGLYTIRLKYHKLTINDREVICRKYPDIIMLQRHTDLAKWINPRSYAAFRLKDRQIAEYNNAFTSIDYLDDFPLWMSWTRDYVDADSQNPKETSMFGSSILNIIWRCIDFIVGGIMSTLVRVGEWFKTFWPLSYYYRNNPAGERHSFLIKFLDMIDARYVVRIDILFIEPFRLFIYKIIRKIFRPFVWLALAPLQIILPDWVTFPQKIMHYLFHRRLGEAEGFWDQFSTSSEQMVFSEELAEKLSKKYQPVAAQALLYFSALLSEKNTNTRTESKPISMYNKDTLEAELFGYHTEDRPEYLQTEKQLARIFEEDGNFGLEHAGYPWLSYGQRLFYLDLIFIPVCLSTFLVLGALLYYYPDSNIIWEWNQAPDHDIFSESLHPKSKHRGLNYFPSSKESFFIDKFLIKVNAEMNAILWDMSPYIPATNTFSDEKYLDDDYFHHI